MINPLNTQLNPICHLLALLGAHSILHVSRIRVDSFPKNTIGNETRSILMENCTLLQVQGGGKFMMAYIFMIILTET